jgi:hypothetical protein
MILLAIAYLNESCQRSGVNAKFRLVCEAETTWHAETGLCPDELYWLTGDPHVAALRKQVGADLVSLFVHGSCSNRGMASLPGAFSVFDGDARVFAHECGHNLGCEHDRANSVKGNRGLLSYVGYVRKTVPPGWSMLANPWIASDNSVPALLADAPDGTLVFKWNEGQ